LGFTVVVMDQNKLGRHHHRSPVAQGAALALAAALVCAAPAMAAPTTPELAAIGLDALLDLEVSGASKFALRASESPSAVTVISAEQMRALGHRTLADVLRSVAGVVVSSDRTYSYLGVRGFSAPGDYNTRVLVLIDGNRINDSVYGQGFLGSEFPLDLDLVERVEFIPGQGSAVHGANALFGVVNVITRRGGISIDREAALALGQGGWRKLRVSGNQPLRDGNLLLSATVERASGSDAYYPGFDAPETNHGISHHTDHESNTQLFAKWVGGDLSATFVHADRSRGLSAFPDTVFNDPRSLYRDVQTLGDLSLRHRIDGATQWKLRLYAGAYSFRGDYIVDHPPVSLNRDTAESRWWGVEGNLFTERCASHKLALGVDLQSSWRRDQTNADLWPVAVTYLDDHRNGTRAALFAEDQWTVAPTLALTAGARVDRLEGADERLSPRFGAVWRPAAPWVLKFTHGTGFRPPNAYELYYATPSGGYKGNPALRDERVVGNEAVAELRPDAASRISLSVYDNRASRLLVESVDPADGMLVFRNVGALHARGIELEAEHAFAHGAQLRANLAVQRLRDMSGQGLDERNPGRLAKLFAVLPRASAWTLGSETVLIGRRGTVAGYGLTNLTLTRAVLAPRALLSLGIDDVLDRRPSDPGSDSVLQPTTPQDGRRVRVKVELRF
jgi:iron complex outermembrane receptor protein